MTIEEEVISRPVRTTAPVVSSTPVARIPSQGLTPLPQQGNTLFNPAVTRPFFGFSMPMNNREYPYVMLTLMMVGLHTNISTFSDNTMAIGPSYNL